jgi:hypothetical protein
MTSSNSDFQQDWGFPSDIKATIPGAAYYEIRPTPENFRTGRPKFECLFLNAEKHKVIEKREAMELISKRTGKPYHVVRRHAAPSPAPAGQAARDQIQREKAAHQQWSIDDALP